MSDRPRVLVVDDNERARTLVRLGLELEGLEVVEAASLAETNVMLTDAFDGFVLDRQLPDGDGLSLLPRLRRRSDAARVIIYSTLEAADEPDGVIHVDKGDLPGVITALGLSAELPEVPALTATSLLSEEREAVAEDWQSLCRWDPELPFDAEPPMALEVIAAVANALGRPQPLGWGVDPVIEQVIIPFAAGVESVELAIGELVCLREAITRRLEGRIPRDEEGETHSRVEMILERAMGAAARQAVARLQDEAYIDPLTGLLNRRAFDRDVRRELSRSMRHDRRFTVVLVDVDSLKRINDVEGYSAGDQVLRSLATALSDSLRAGDAAYRIGGDEFVLLLTDVGGSSAETVIDRVVEAGAPGFAWGAAVFPNDGDGVQGLLDAADAGLRRNKNDP